MSEITHLIHTDGDKSLCGKWVFHVYYPKKEDRVDPGMQIESGRVGCEKCLEMFGKLKEKES